MKPLYRTFFGFAREPFSAELNPEQILQTEDVIAVAQRLDYAVNLGSIALITGEVGSGKSTALRWALSRLHPSQYRSIWITASSGSILELYRMLTYEFEMDSTTSSRALLLKTIRRQILELTQARKQKVVLITRMLCFQQWVENPRILPLPGSCVFPAISGTAGDDRRSPICVLFSLILGYKWPITSTVIEYIRTNW